MSNVDLKNSLNKIICLEDDTISDGFFNVLDAASIVAAAVGCLVIKPIFVSSEEFFKLLNIPVFDFSETTDVLGRVGICFVKKFRLIEINEFLASFDKDLSLYFSFSSMEKLRKLQEEIKSISIKHSILVTSKHTQTGVLNSLGDSEVIEIEKEELNASINTKGYVFSPEKYGIKKGDKDSLTGATALYNANLLQEIFKGQIKGAKLDTIAINAGIIIYLCGKSKNLIQGIMKAYWAIDKGFAYNQLVKIQKIY